MNRLILFVLCLLPSMLLANDALHYQARNDHWEGVTVDVQTTEDIELVSAIIQYQTTWEPAPTQSKIQFYLPEAADIDLTIQELRPKHAYKLDRVKTDWKTGWNTYEWATKDVINPLELNIAHLGAIAHFKQEEGEESLTVAPVIFYNQSLPTEIKGYLFAFKVKDSATLKYSIYQGTNMLPLIEGDLGKQSTGEPFVVFWESEAAEAGHYELIVEGNFLDSALPIRQSVRFYHQPEFH